MRPVAAASATPRWRPCPSFHVTATTQLYTLSLHDALPIYDAKPDARSLRGVAGRADCAAPYHPRHHRRSEEHTSELQSQSNLVCRLLLEKKNRSSDQGCPGDIPYTGRRA